jgi:ABC-type molybdate transport system permease subunit
MQFPGRGVLLALFTAPLLLPTIVLGLALLLVFSQLGLLATFPGLILGHSLVGMPYVVRLMLTAIGGVPPAVEEAATTLGAGPAMVFYRVTLPLMRPALVAAAALASLAAFDEGVISRFIVGPRMTTLPIALFRYVQYHADPEVSALSVVLIAFTVAIIGVVERSNRGSCDPSLGEWHSFGCARGPRPRSRHSCRGTWSRSPIGAEASTARMPARGGAARSHSSGEVRNLRALGFPGRVYAVHPSASEIEGWPAVATIANLPEGIVTLAGGLELKPARSHRLRRLAGKRLLLPDLDRPGPNVSIVARRHTMATPTEVAVNDGVGAQELLRLAG